MEIMATCYIVDHLPTFELNARETNIYEKWFWLNILKQIKAL